VFKDLKNQAQTLSQLYKRDENRVIWVSIKVPFTDSMAMAAALLKFAILDLSLKKFPHDSLILVATANMEIRVEYLNRVS
jgi:chondroitin polymerizing factor/chondroitin polymerizing factor 2